MGVAAADETFDTTAAPARSCVCVHGAGGFPIDAAKPSLLHKIARFVTHCGENGGVLHGEKALPNAEKNTATLSSGKTRRSVFACCLTMSHFATFCALRGVFPHPSLMSGMAQA